MAPKEFSAQCAQCVGPTLLKEQMRAVFPREVKVSVRFEAATMVCEADSPSGGGETERCRSKRAHSASARARPVLWPLVNKRRRADDVPARADASACAEPREPTVDEQSTRIPCGYLRANLFMKRRLYLQTQDPRALLCSKALEKELRRRMEIAMAALQCHAS